MSCCSCGCNPCSCGSNIAPVTCCTPTTESVEYTFENGGLQGVGVFDNETDNLVQFRSIASDTLALTVTLDAPTKSIIISFNDELLIDDVPTATETQRGIAEVATQVETNAGALDDKIITPLKLNDRTATETRTGIAEIATQSEVTTGTDDTRIITPLKLATFAGTQKTTRVFADAVARAAATPTFDGQLGIQLDNNALIVATGTTAGSFSPNIVIAGTLDVSGQINAASSVALFGTINADESSVSGLVVNATGIFTTSAISFETGTIFQINGVPATDSVLIGGTLGAADAIAVSQFLSSENVNTGWTNFSNSTVRKTGDCNTITLPQLAQVVDTLIQTLGTSHLLPTP